MHAHNHTILDHTYIHIQLYKHTYTYYMLTHIQTIIERFVQMDMYSYVCTIIQWHRHTYIPTYRLHTCIDTYTIILTFVQMDMYSWIHTIVEL